MFVGFIFIKININLLFGKQIKPFSLSRGLLRFFFDMFRPKYKKGFCKKSYFVNILRYCEVPPPRKKLSKRKLFT